ncbi:WecB/TagA/CpsF family glycosyltransferase [Paludibaculum fermentans]|uniref:WecB/TagA/CpsF family glycosyltransferase n=1 Tax=Paludibaculum fermentans TaxID=1473598 RepID=A0A7S7NME8_PALFE|nr:WecB/TagA/CpsF family glycosyltransferase [Paludibaculum fermentans]
MENDRRVDMLGVSIDMVSPAEVLAKLIQWRIAKHRGYISCVNPHSVLVCHREEQVRSAITGSDLILADGVGITVGGYLLGHRHIQRVAGPSLVLDICDGGRSAGLRHFFYGGGEGVADSLVSRLRERFSGLNVCGTICPPFRELTPLEDADLVEQINAANPDVVWVGLGTGRQEKWMESHVGRVRAAALVGVGAAFDFHAGTVPWAPYWIRRAGLEWAFRLAHEPRRLWRRNLDSPIFVARIIAQRISENASHG